MEGGRQQGRLMYSLLSSNPHLRPMKLRTRLPTRAWPGQEAWPRYRAGQPKLVYPRTVIDVAPVLDRLLIQATTYFGQRQYNHALTS